MRSVFLGPQARGRCISPLLSVGRVTMNSEQVKNGLRAACAIPPAKSLTCTLSLTPTMCYLN